VSATITLPRILRIGAGASGELATVLEELGLARPCVVSDPFLLAQGVCERITAPLDAAGVPWSLFGDCVPDPTTDSVASALAAFRSGNHDCLVAVGGGSSLDTAKAVAVLARHGGAMRDYRVPAAVQSSVPVVAIPTTAGTGSEVTRAAVITDSESGEKMLCMGLGLVPVAALVDFELTLSMPRRLTADTGIDSLCHALEAYVSRRANPFTDGIALSAMATISRHLRTACDQPGNREAREAMMLAATQGGMAFANASVTLIHGMSRPLGAHFHVPHGLSNAMLLPEVTAWSVCAAPERYAHCARVMGLATAGDTDSMALDKLVAGLRQLNADLEVPGPRDYGIDAARWQASLATMAEQALASGSPANNPRIPEAEDIVALYRQVWQG
jgi:alcohol dehydrogenase class IV